MKTIAAMIIFLSSFFLLKNLGIIQVDFDFWGVFWPLIFLTIGLKILFSSKPERKYTAWGWGAGPRFDQRDQGCDCEKPDCSCKNSGDDHS
ncbi:MAG: DUF5668 domain-containing protein [Candidatus Paceibacterota bacterium]|jgi:hypothetical protein